MSLSTEFIKECLTYDPQSGQLFWKVRPREHFPSNRCWLHFNKCYAGEVAGSQHYCRGLPHAIKLTITRDGKAHELHAHNVIFTLMGVVVPTGMLVDHKDVDPFNNAWINLRLATIGQNSQNKVSNRDRKHALPKGVYVSGGRYRASIFIGGKSKALGTFSTAAEAHNAYVSAAVESFGEFARFN